MHRFIFAILVATLLAIPSAIVAECETTTIPTRGSASSATSAFLSLQVNGTRR